MNFYWVNIGQSYEEVLKNKFLWAPVLGETPIDEDDPARGTRTRTYRHWDNVGHVKAGDIIFCNVDRNIRFVAVAREDAFPAPRPLTRTFSHWNSLGNQVGIDIFPLPSPMSIGGYICQTFQTRYNSGSQPAVIMSNGNVFQGYMASIPDAAGIELLSLADEVEVFVVEASNRIHRPGIPARKAVGATTKQALRESRIGQGFFRKELIKMWSVCPVSGVRNLDLLMASHTKPWAKSDDVERLDPFNGFLFAPHVDRLFDKGLISFGNDGKIIVSKILSISDCNALNIHRAISIPIVDKHRPYLKAHREIFSDYL